MLSSRNNLSKTHSTRINEVKAFKTRYSQQPAKHDRRAHLLLQALLDYDQKAFLWCLASLVITVIGMLLFDL